MLSSTKSEYRKVLTVRSTYVIFGLLLVIMLLFAFYAQGIKAAAGTGEGVISDAIKGGTGIISAIAGIIGVLMVTHEYRYNTIMYTLTSSNSRTKSLLAKIIVLTTVSLFLTAFFGILIPLLIRLGASVGNVTLAPQTIYYKELIWQSLFTGWAGMMYAVLLSLFIRHQVGAVASYFMIPTTVEPIMGIILKENAIYLPFNIMTAVTYHTERIAPGRAAVIVHGYIIGGMVLAFILFRKRDAN